MQCEDQPDGSTYKCKRCEKNGFPTLRKLAIHYNSYHPEFERDLQTAAPVPVSDNVVNRLSQSRKRKRTTAPERTRTKDVASAVNVNNPATVVRGNEVKRSSERKRTKVLASRVGVREGVADRSYHSRGRKRTISPASAGGGDTAAYAQDQSELHLEKSDDKETERISINEQRNQSPPEENQGV